MSFSIQRGNLRREFEIVLVLRRVEELLSDMIQRAARNVHRSQFVRDRFQSHDSICAFKRTIQEKRDICPTYGEEGRQTAEGKTRYSSAA